MWVQVLRVFRSDMRLQIVSRHQVYFGVHYCFQPCCCRKKKSVELKHSRSLARGRWRLCHSRDGTAALCPFPWGRPSHCGSCSNTLKTWVFITDAHVTTLDPAHQLFFNKSFLLTSCLTYIDIIKSVNIEDTTLSVGRWLSYMHLSGEWNSDIVSYFAFHMRRKSVSRQTQSAPCAFWHRPQFPNSFCIHLSVSSHIFYSCCPWQPGVWSGRTRVRAFHIHTHTQAHRHWKLLYSFTQMMKCIILYIPLHTLLQQKQFFSPCRYIQIIKMTL